MALKTVCFELTMPNRGSWNGRWSGEKEGHYHFERLSDGVAQKLDGRDWYYGWGDGWGANVSARIVTGTESRRLRKQNAGFCGYDWMVKSILACGEIKLTW